MSVPAATSDSFCVGVQQALAGTNLPMRNDVHDTFESFKKSKVSIQPLTIHQFVLFDDSARTQPLRISCKTKTADQLNETYGANSATGGGAQCRDIHRAIVKSTWNGLTPEERARSADAPNRILLDADRNTYMGSRWVSDYDYVYRDAEGRLHLFAKTLHVAWDDWRFAWAPDRVRGVQYCHLIAPEHLRRIMLGEVSLPNAEPN